MGLGPRLKALRQLVEDVGDLVHPTTPGLMKGGTFGTLDFVRSQPSKQPHHVFEVESELFEIAPQSATPLSIFRSSPDPLPMCFVELEQLKLRRDEECPIQFRIPDSDYVGGTALIPITVTGQ